MKDSLEGQANALLAAADAESEKSEIAEEPADRSYRAPSGSISQFQAEIDWHMAAGLPYYQAYHKAVDYYRKFIWREILPDDFHSLDDHETTDLKVDELVDFNVIFEKVMHATRDDDKLCKLYCLFIAYESLVDNLLPMNRAMLSHMIGDQAPESYAEIATMLGYKVRENGSSSGFDHCFWKLRDLLTSTTGIVKTMANGRHSFA